MDYYKRIIAQWYSFATHFEAGVGEFFETLGRSVAKFPYRYIGGVFLFVVACAVGFLRLNLVSEGEKIWVPQDSEALHDSDYISQTYSASFRGGSVLFVATTAANNDLLNLDAFEALWRVHAEIANKVVVDGKKWDDLCGMRHNDGSCFSVGPLEMWKFNKTHYDETVHSREDLILILSQNRYPNGAVIRRDLIYGEYTTEPYVPSAGAGPTLDIDSLFTSCKGMMQYYYIDGTPVSVGMAYEESYIKTLQHLDLYSGSTVSSAVESANSIVGTSSTSTSSSSSTGVVPLTEFYYFADRSMNDELANAVGGDVSLMVMTYTFMVVFTCTVLARKRNFVGTRTALGCSGVGIVVLAIIAGYGFCSGLGVLFTSIHQVLPFIIVGVGVDDMFIIVAAFDAQDEKLHIEERLGQGLRRCGFSITYTTATDVFAFLLGASSRLPAIQSFCIYAGVSMLFNFCFQITMFCALLCLDAERSKQNKLDILCCVTADSCCMVQQQPNPRQVLAIVEPKDTEAGGDNAAVPVPMPVPADTASAASISTVFVGTTTGDDDIKKNNTEEEVEKEEELSALQHIFGNVYWPLLKLPAFRWLIIVVFIAVSGVCIYGTTRLTQGFDMIDLVPDHSYVRTYIEQSRALNLYVIDQNSPVMFVYKDIQYHLQSSQEGMLQLQSDFLTEDTHGHSKGPFSSWISDFTVWVRSDDAFPYNSSVNADGYLTDPVLFYEAVDTFLIHPSFSHFESDIILASVAGASTNRSIVSSRVSAFLGNIGDPMTKMEAMSYCRDLMKASPLEPKPFAFSFTFVFTETEVIIADEMKQNLALALAAVMFVSLFVLIQPKAVFLIACMVAVIDADLLGGMYYWGLQVNTVTVVQLVMAVGLVVDYVAHILHCYMQQPTDLDSIIRLRMALIEIGPSVLMGASTTFLGIMPLVLASSAIFRTFFKMFVLIIVFGASHGLILLPAMIAMFEFDDISAHRSVAEDKMERILSPQKKREKEERKMEGVGYVHQKLDQHDKDNYGEQRVDGRKLESALALVETGMAGGDLQVVTAAAGGVDACEGRIDLNVNETAVL